jgi:hypothetical protein
MITSYRISRKKLINILFPDFKKIIGRITRKCVYSKNNSYIICIEYSYKIDGKQYEGDTFSYPDDDLFSTQESAKDILRNYLSFGSDTEPNIKLYVHKKDFRKSFINIKSMGLDTCCIFIATSYSLIFTVMMKSYIQYLLNIVD